MCYNKNTLTEYFTPPHFTTKSGNHPSYDHLFFNMTPAEFNRSPLSNGMISLSRPAHYRWALRDGTIINHYPSIGERLINFLYYIRDKYHRVCGELDKLTFCENIFNSRR